MMPLSQQPLSLSHTHTHTQMASLGRANQQPNRPSKMEKNNSPPPQLPPPVLFSTPPRETSSPAVQTSIQALLIKWQRRRRWKPLLRCCPAVKADGGNNGTAAPWRTRLANFLESTPVHLVALCLLLLDLAFTILDLSSSPLLPCSHDDENRKEEQERGGGFFFFHWGGVAILGVLSARTAAQVVALGGSFFSSPGRMVDGVVVAGALLLELLLVRSDGGGDGGGGGAAGGLLVVVSLWRVVRVVESAFELSDEAIGAQIEEITSRFESLKEENRLLREASSDKDERIAKLEEELAQLRYYAMV